MARTLTLTAFGHLQEVEGVCGRFKFRLWDRQETAHSKESWGAEGGGGNKDNWF